MSGQAAPWLAVTGAGSATVAAMLAAVLGDDGHVVDLPGADLPVSSPRALAVLDLGAGAELVRRCVGPGTLVVHLREDVAAGRLAAEADVRVAVTLGSPRAGELGVVEDLLVDRAFPEVPGEASVVATFADLMEPTPELVLAALVSAALARSYGVPADAVAAGLRAFALPKRG